jgi:hypothetical protein
LSTSHFNAVDKEFSMKKAAKDRKLLKLNKDTIQKLDEAGLKNVQGGGGSCLPPPPAVS